ncbi:MAG: type II toxin-antitoxin system HicA family toxin [Betaproteobacteria bacterium]|nr:type II toxin-antitoxin system HicA family toxin [Betaproteobacteria bacterium]
MNGNQQDTLRQIYANPVPVNLEWRKVESLLLAIGCQLVEGRGSRVRFEKNGKVATFHRPHPAKEAKPYQVRDARAYLELLGVAP